jgi:CBS domain-containing protein
MRSIYDLVRGRKTHDVSEKQSVLDVARLMVEHNIGAVPVVRDGDLIGIFSERDLLKRVVAEGRDPAKTLVGEVMTPEPLVVKPNETIEHCMIVMKQHSFRHLPVCDGQKMVGIVSLRDIMLHDLEAKDDEIITMRQYIQTNAS